MYKRFLLTAFLLMAANHSHAGEADVIDVKISGTGPEFRFTVTVKHADAGWDHYADAWEVVGEDGTVYGKRILAHPHDNEQPFTRSGTATVPAGVASVIVRAHDSVHGYGGIEQRVDLPN